MATSTEYNCGTSLNIPASFTAGKIFINVHFRMNTKTYGTQGWSRTEDRQAFFDEAIQFMQSLGFEGGQGKYASSCPTMKLGDSSLYLHPQDFSGEIELAEFERIKAAFEQHTGLFTLYHVDVYSFLEDITESELLSRLAYYKSDIQQAFLSVLQTTRKTQFKRIGSYSSVVGRLKGFEFNSLSANTHNRTIYNFCDTVIAELVAQGKIITCEHPSQGKVYRSANARELKALEKPAKRKPIDTNQAALSF